MTLHDQDAGDQHLETRWAKLRPWCAVAGLFGAGLLPCPDCGAPMAIHFWPIAIGLALRTYARRRSMSVETSKRQNTTPTTSTSSHD